MQMAAHARSLSGQQSQPPSVKMYFSRLLYPYIYYFST